jgi:Cu/Ag efflux pump CusA
MAVGKIPLMSPDGQVVTLAELARVRERSGQSVILHRGAQRVQLVTANVTGSAGRFASLAAERLARLRLAPGDYLRVDGTAQASAHARAQLWVDFLLAMLAILALLFIALGDVRSVGLLMVNLPFALLGGIVAIWVARLPVSLGAAVGFVTVFGITLRNAIMLLSHYRTLVIEEGRPWNRETVEMGAMNRLAPILMTASVTALGLLPLALGAHRAGQEIGGPMAIVILGGLISSTALSLLIVPTLALRVVRFSPTEAQMGFADPGASATLDS